MENYEKIHPAKISHAIDWENFVKSAKSGFNGLLPFALRLGLSISAALILLSLQFFAVGVFDRLSLSPKISLIISSLFYAAIFAVLAIVGGIKSREVSGFFEANIETRPICKMLIIRRKKM